MSNDSTNIKKVETQAEALIQNSPDAIISIEDNGKIIGWNLGAEKIFEYEASEVLNENILLIIPTEYKEQHEIGLARYIATRVPYILGKTVELSGVKRSGIIFPIEMTLFTWENSGVKKISAIIRDISARKDVEKKLKSSELRARSITEFAGDAIISINREGNIISWNRGAERVFGYTFIEVENKNVTLIIPEEYQKAHNAGIERFLRTGIPKIIGTTKELTGIRKSGQQFPIDLTLSYWEDSEEIYFTGIIRDITEKKEAEAKIRMQEAQVIASQQKALESSSKLAILGEMVASIAHEINTPLAAILMRVTLMSALNEQNALSKEKVAVDLMKLQNTTERISKIVKGLKSLSRNADEDPFEKVSIKSVVNESLEFCTPRLVEKGIEFRLKNDLDELVSCREVQLSQVIINLVNNAADAVAELPEKWVELEVTKNERQKKLYITITDSGKGIPPEIAKKLMTSFFSTKKVGKGTGLGLSISKKIINQHGGDLLLDQSCPNTRFVIDLPI